MKTNYRFKKSELSEATFSDTKRLELSFKWALALLLCIGCSMLSKAQTFNGFKEVYTQQDVNNLGAEGYTSITQGLYIRNSTNITDLTPLSTLTSLGALFIGDNTNLTNLTGLHNITQITGAGTGEGLYIARNAQLNNLTGLGGINVISERLVVENNPLLVSLAGLNVSQIEQLNIFQNNVLQNLSGLENLTNVGSSGISINDNPALTDLSGLNSITTVSGGGIIIGSNNSLTQINGFNNLTATNLLGINGNPLVSNYCGLVNWASANPTFSNFGTSSNAYNPSLAQVISACDGNAVNTTTTITDPIFEQYLIDNNIDMDPVVNGSVLTSAISGISELKINSFDISDFTGLEDFTSLVEFEMINNQAASIQPISFTGNTSLDKITIINSPNLPSVDISQNNALTDVAIVTRGTVFNSINLTGKTNLLLLQLADNNISTIDLSPVPNLTFLGLAINPITSLDVSGFADLEALDTYQSQITSLDLSSNGKLTRLDGKNGVLTSINLKNGFNTNLISVNLDGNAGLSCIEVDDIAFATQQTTAGNWVKDATASYSINCNAPATTQITDDAFEASLEDIGAGDGIANNDLVSLPAVQNLTTLQMSGGFNGQLIQSLAGIEAFSILETLDVSNNQVTTLPLASNSSLISVKANNNQIATVSFSTSGSLQVIELNSNDLATINLNNLFGLEVLSVSENRLTSIDFSSNPGIEILDVSDNLLTALDITPMAPILNTLNFSLNQIPSINLSTASALSSLTAFDSGLTSLDLKNLAFGQLSSINVNLNQGLNCIEVSNVASAEQEVANGNWVVDPIPGIFKLDCAANPCTVVAISDPEFKNFLLNNTFEDINGNFISIAQSGEVCAELAASVVTLDLVTVGGIDTFTVVSLAGIEAFTELKTLNIGQDFQVLSDVDVSQNLNLEVLIASSFKGSGFNLQLENNPNLKELYTYNSGASLTISPINNPLLEVLSIGAFNINPFPQSSINLSGYTNLKEFRAQEIGGITSLGLSNASTLEKIYLDQTSLTSLDLSGSPLLNDISATFNTDLAFINLKNGTNDPSLQSVSIGFNDASTCVQVDSTLYSESQVNLGNWSIDQSTISEDCNSLYTLIPDPNFEQALIDQGIDSIFDGKILTSAAQAETNLDVANSNIGDLTGIAAFTSLVYLGAAFNNLTEINLSGNINLIEVRLAQNAISDINVSQIQALEILDLGNNSIPSIDLSMNGNLESLDLSNNGALEMLDVTGNTSLTNISVLNSFGLTALDVSTLINLESLTTARSGIISLDLSNNLKIRDLVLGVPTMPADNSSLQFLNLKNDVNPLPYDLINLQTRYNLNMLCIQVHSVQEAEGAMWDVDQSTTFKLDCTASTITSIQFQQASGSGFEVENSDLPTLFINGTITNPSTITLEDLTNGSATPSTTTTNGDYIFNGGNTTYTLTIPPGNYDGTTPFSIPDFEILDDFIYENNEVLNLQITGVTGDLTLGSVTDFQYTILEDDYVAGIVADDNEASEAGDTGSFVIGLFDNTGALVTNTTGSELTIAFNFSGSAAASDFNALTSAVIPQGENSISIPITAVDDTLVESSETVICTLIQGANYKLDNSKPQTDTVTILDNDTGTPTSFEAEVQLVTDIPNTLNVNEGNTEIELQMFIPNADTDNLLVDFDIEVVELSAFANADFRAVPANETFTYEYFNDGFTVYNIGILQDILLEGNEQFLVRISNPSDNRVQLKNADSNGVLELVVTILDNEITNAVLMGTDGIEGGKARFDVRLEDSNGNPVTNNTGNDIDFDIQLTDGTATTPEDYTNLGTNTKITIGNFAAGGFIEVSLIDDTLAEPQENLTATISNSSLGRITISQPTANANIAASDNTGGDSDSDGVLDTNDNCINTPNADQADLDNDGQGDVCDTDRDGDGVLNVDDTCPDLAGVAANNGCPQSDSDGDGILDAEDNCVNTPNADQLDDDNDGIGNVCDPDIDGDGVANANDNCMFTPNPQQEDADGDGIGDACDTTTPETELTLNPEDIEVIAQAESCPDVANGSIVVLALADEEFTVTLSGSNLASPLQGPLNSSTLFFQNNLAAGSYEVCITANNFPGFEQCFVANVLNSENISVANKGIDLRTKKAAFEVEGSTSYSVQVNDQTYQYQFNSPETRLLEVPMENGKNEVRINGLSDCQGVFKETVFLGQVTAYPNPVIDVVNISGLPTGKTFEVSIATLSGTVVRHSLHENLADTIPLEISELSTGLYVLTVKSPEQTSTIKIIKK